MATKLVPIIRADLVSAVLTSQNAAAVYLACLAPTDRRLIEYALDIAGDIARGAT